MFAPPRSVLVFAPHADDEALGCGGLLTRWARSGNCPQLTLVRITRTSEERAEEFQAVASRLGARVVEMAFVSHGLNPSGSLVDQCEEEINAAEADVVLLPGSSFHADHRAVRLAAFAAMRPEHCPSVRTVLSYETPYYAWALTEDTYVPNFYVRLNWEQAHAKTELCALHRSQQFHGLRRQASIWSLLRQRGRELEPFSFEGGSQAEPYAEAFRLERHAW